MRSSSDDCQLNGGAENNATVYRGPKWEAAAPTGKNIQDISMKSGDDNGINNPVRVLVIEDNIDDSDLLVRQLQKNSFSGCVKIIADGKEAWNFLVDDSRQNLVAIFLDLNLPSLSGIKLLERIRSHPELCTIPIYVMTCSNNPKDLEECARHGVEGYIIKPVTFLTFSKAIADLFHTNSVNGYAKVE